MTDVYLRAASKEEMQSAFEDAGLLIDEVRTEPVCVFDEDGNEDNPLERDLPPVKVFKSGYVRGFGQIDLVGIVMNNDEVLKRDANGDPVTDNDGEPVILKAATAKEGWHVNIRLDEGAELPDALKPFLLAPPAKPKRVFA